MFYCFPTTFPHRGCHGDESGIPFGGFKSFSIFKCHVPLWCTSIVDVHMYLVHLYILIVFKSEYTNHICIETLEGCLITLSTFYTVNKQPIKNGTVNNFENVAYVW